MGYDQLIKQHLADYKSKTLGIRRDGIWKRSGKRYPHILPEDREILNILPAYREEFCGYFDDNGIRLHKDFHHLNSSQAMCFNLFFPFLAEDKLGLLISVLSLPPNEIRNAEFEKVLEKSEGTNFDFFIEMVSGSRIFFEVKLSESDFGTAPSDTTHRKKLDETYRPRLIGKVMEQYLEESLFFHNYQILRNISYIGNNGADVLLFIFPRGNEKLAGMEQIMRRMVTDNFSGQVRINYLEDFVDRILESIDGKDTRIVQHYNEFKKKYILDRITEKEIGLSSQGLE
jgi:hypothetical protein